MANDDAAAAAAAAQAAKERRLADEAAAHAEAEAATRAEEARRAKEARLCDAALDEYERAHEALWAQATAVVNVKALIPVILDQATNTYSKWRGMFLTILGKYALTRHVLEDEAFPSRPAWVQADCCVLTWIYGTVSSDLQQSLMMRQGPARGTWCYLEDEFLSNKESRALLLETKFRNFRQESLTVTDYCRRLESMAASLTEFGDPIGDRQMVFTLLRGLSGKFQHMVAILKLHRPFPTFAEARTHLLLEEMEIDARPPSPPSALVAAAPRPTAPGAPTPPRLGAPPAARPPGAPGTGQRNGHRRGRGGRGPPQAQVPSGPQGPPSGAPMGGHGGVPAGVHPSFAYPWAGTMQMYPYDRRPPAAFTAVPQHGSPFDGVLQYGAAYNPSPYGSFYEGAAPQSQAFQGSPPPYQVQPVAPWNPTVGGSWNQDTLAQSFNTMTLNQPAPSEWYADSGAGSHMTADAGTTPSAPHAVHGTVPVHGTVAAPELSQGSPDLGAAAQTATSSASSTPVHPGAAAPVHRVQVVASSNAPMAPSSTAGTAAPGAHAQVAASGTGRTTATRPIAITPVTNAHSPLPRSVRDALSDPNWRSAMQAEYDALLANHTWSLVPRPPGVNLVTGKWIYRHKLLADGSLDCYKAR
ncbi:uncharacterized protein [Miscanthus floridulus]|uniref:uncharacterized protein n=1 Tax=Miscanthus floridulus TaxID=154761 RepID=UPI00345AD172